MTRESVSKQQSRNGAILKENNLVHDVGNAAEEYAKMKRNRKSNYAAAEQKSLLCLRQGKKRVAELRS